MKKGRNHEICGFEGDGYRAGKRKVKLEHYGNAKL